MTLLGGAICECAATINTLIRDKCDSQRCFDAVVAFLVVLLVRYELFPAREDQSASSVVSQQFAPIKARCGPFHQCVPECLIAE